MVEETGVARKTIAKLINTGNILTYLAPDLNPGSGDRQRGSFATP